MPLEIANFSDIPNELEITRFEVSPQGGGVLVNYNLNNRKMTPPPSGSAVSGSVVNIVATRSLGIYGDDATNLFNTVIPAGSTLYSAVKQALYNYISENVGVW